MITESLLIVFAEMLTSYIAYVVIYIRSDYNKLNFTI